jgi:hypothetical protein
VAIDAVDAAMANHNASQLSLLLWDEDSNGLINTSCDQKLAGSM